VSEAVVRFGSTRDPSVRCYLSPNCAKADIGKAFVINLGFGGTRPTTILET
jgi:hypothetical protein